MQRAMAVEQEAARDAKAIVTAASGELMASEDLTKAADMLKQSPMSFHLRFLQTLANASTESNHTIIVPFPVQLSRKIFARFQPANTMCCDDPNCCAPSASGVKTSSKKLQTKPETRDQNV